MKKVLALALALIMLMSLSACSSGGETPSQADNEPSTQQEENGRTKATEFAFELAEEEERVVENLIFDEDVTISGDFGTIVFENCEFNANIINTAEQFTRVILPEGTDVNGDCVFKNTTKEATMDSPIPKFFSPQNLNIVCEDCVGSCVLESKEGSITFNGESYSLAGAEFVLDPETNDLVPYDGQEVSVLFIGQWWENGEKTLKVFCE